jgi:hypothetical protein
MTIVTFLNNDDSSRNQEQPQSLVIVKKFGVDFDSGMETLVLPPEYIFADGLGKSYDDCANRKFCSRLHDNGWLITGKISEDYFYWVNRFKARHPKLGKVWGDFSKEVFADTEEGYQDFFKNFPPKDFDYDEI